MMKLEKVKESTKKVLESQRIHDTKRPGTVWVRMSSISPDGAVETAGDATTKTVKMSE
jgi:3-hydroxyisobutyrate dehydrogenase-like beta-hydroxyacid dehydrogenase